MDDDSKRDLEQLTQTVRELSARIVQLERRMDAAFAGRMPPARAGRPASTVTPIAPPRSGETRLESRIGSQWLNRVGVVAVLFGVAYLLRYVFVSGWVSAEVWIWAGALAGLAVVAGSEWFRRNGYRVLSLSLKATGIGISYLSLWAGLELYRIFSAGETFVALVLLTALAVVLAVREVAQVVAALAFVAGFLTPLLISVPSSEAPLFLYLVILDCAVAGLALQRAWWKLLWLAGAGTTLVSAIWYFQHYKAADLDGAVAGATVYFILFAVSIAWSRRRLPRTAQPAGLLVLDAVNAAVYFTGLDLLLWQEHQVAFGATSAVLAAFYFMRAWKREAGAPVEDRRTSSLYIGLGIAFAAATLAILLTSDWLSLGWFVEAAAIMAIGFWRDLPRLRWGGLALLCAAIVKAFVYDVWQLSLGYRTLSFIALGVLLLVISFVYQRHGFALMAKPGKDNDAH